MKEILSFLPNKKGFVTFLLLNEDKISWSVLCENSNAMHLLYNIIKENTKQISWSGLSKSENAVHFLKQDLHKIIWSWLSLNKSHNAVALLEANRDKINWQTLSTNPSAIHMCNSYHECKPG